jgi:hypothetical protein
MRKRPLIALVMLGLGLSGAWWILASHPEVVLERHAPESRSPPPASSPQPLASANPPAGRLQLEVTEASVGHPADAFSSLKAKANAGEISAACQLAFELHRCAQLPSLESGLLQMRRQAYQLEERSTDRAKLEVEIASRTAAIDEYRASCDGIDPKERREGWRYLLAAANAGHLPSMLRFIHGLGLNWSGRPLDDLEQWIAYRDNMPSLLERAVASGHPDAYAAAAKLYTRAPFGKSPVGRDPVKSLAFRLALVRTTAGDQARAIEEVQINRFIAEEKLDSAAVARAESLATPLVAKLDLASAKTSFPNGGCDVRASGK